MENVQPPKGYYWELIPETTSTTLKLMKRRFFRKNETMAHIWMDSVDPKNIEKAARATLDVLKETGKI